MNKTLKIILIMLVVLGLAIGTLFCIDSYMMKNNKPVIFSTWGNDYAAPENKMQIPKLKLTTKDGEEAICKIGSYSWSENGQSVVADAIHPADFEYASENMLKVSDNTIILKNQDSIIKYVNIYRVGEYDTLPIRFDISDSSITFENYDIDEFILAIILEYENGTVNYSAKIINESNEASIKEYSFTGKVIESTVYDGNHNIVVEPLEGEFIRRSSDKISIGLGKTDALYAVGTYVFVEYDGNVLETYPASISASKVDVLNSKFNLNKDEFELYYGKVPEEFSDEMKVIARREELQKNYDVYACENIGIMINGKPYNLRDALLQDEISAEDIVVKANRDASNPDVVKVISYKDGGTVEYHYEDFTIIKVHSLDGNRDVYIGDESLNYNKVI